MHAPSRKRGGGISPCGNQPQIAPPLLLWKRLGLTSPYTSGRRPAVSSSSRSTLVGQTAIIGVSMLSIVGDSRWVEANFKEAIWLGWPSDSRQRLNSTPILISSSKAGLL
jgi:hypothetical protein